MSFDPDTYAGGFDPEAYASKGEAARSALSWLTTPSKAMQPIIDKNKATQGGGIIGKDSSDTMASIASAVSGIPGFQPHDASPEYDDRMRRFAAEHTWASRLLPLAGGLAKPGALPGKAAEATVEMGGALPRALDRLANKAGRRVLYGGANGLSERFPVPDSSIEAAHRVGAFKPLGTTEHAANVLSDALDEAGSIKGEVIKEMEAAGIQGPDSAAVAQVLRSKAAYFRKNSAGTRIPELYEKIADDIEQAGSGRLGVKQSENIKRSLQDAARYGDPNERMLNVQKRKIASVLRQSVEHASGYDAATIGTPQLQAIRKSLQEVRDFHNMGASEPPLPGDLRPSATPAEIAAQDAHAAALSRAAQEADAKLIPAKQAYAQLAPAAAAAEKGLSQATKRNAFGLRETIMAAPMAAAHGAGAGAAMGLLSKAATTYGPSTVAWGAKRAANMSRRVLPLTMELVARGVPQDLAESIANSQQQ